MAQVNFYRGVRDRYSDSTHANGIYFATDTHEILMSNVAYGLSASDLSNLKEAIKGKVASVQFTSPNTIVFKDGNDPANTIATVTLPEATSSTAGLMAAADKATLDKAVGDIAALQESVTDNHIVARDASVTVTPGDGKTTIAVNLKADNNALKLDATEGLYVDETALTSYEGVNAITITDKAEAEGVKEIALKISADDKILSQTADGLLATFAIAKLDAATEGYAASYQLQDKDGNALGATIDIPKDMVVSKGEVKTVETTDQPYSGAVVGDKYIELTIANASKSPLWIPVKDLVDIYTSGNGINVNGSNVISVVVDPTAESFLTVGAAGIKLAGVQNAINKAKTTIDDYTINTKKISTNPVLDGADIALTDYNYSGMVTATDTVNSAIQKLDTALQWVDVQ